MLENKDVDGKFINATWTDKTYKDLENVNLKYKDNAAAAKLYKRSLDSLAKAKALDTRSSQANLNVTKTSAMADKIKSASLYAKSGAYKIAAAAVNLFNSAIVREIALTAAISIGVMAVFSALTKLWEAVPTQNHLKEWAEESATALQETRDEIDSTKSELETIGERIDELQSKGSLSFTEQEELERLQKENLELEKRLAILKKTEELQNKEATEDAWAVIEGMANNNASRANSYSAGSIGDGTVAEQIEDYAKLKLAAEEAQRAIDKDDQDALEKWDKQQEKIDQYDEKISKLVSDANNQLANIDPSLLTDEQLAEYDKLQGTINNWLVSAGELSLDDVLKSALGVDQYDVAIKKMQELADSGKKVTESGLKEYLGQDMADEIANTVGGYDNLIERVNSMKNIGKVIAGYNGADKNNVLANISELINSEIAKIDADAIENNFSDKFIKYLDECGISAKYLISYLQEMQTEANNIDFSDALTELTEIGDAIETLNDAYEQFAEDGYVDNDKLTKVAEQFASINDSDAYKDFIKTISDSNSTIDAVEKSMENLVNTYMTSNDVMSNLTEKNRGLYESRLKSMGVANSYEIVEYNLQKAILGSANATAKAKKEAADAMAVLMQEEWALKAVGVAALDAGTKMQLFAAYEAYAAGNNFADVISNHAVALGKVAEAAGPAAAKLKQYIEVVNKISQIQEGLLDPKQKSGWAYMRNSLPALYDQLDSLASDAQEEFLDLATPDIDFTPGATADINTGKDSDSGDTPAEKRKKKYDAAKKKLDYQLEQNIISYDTYYKKLKALGEKYLKGQKGNVQDYRDHLQEMADIRESAFDDEKDDLEKRLEDGDISITTYYNKITSAMNKWLKGFKSNSDAYKDAQRELADKIFDYWESRISKTQEKIDHMNLMGTRNPNTSEKWYWKELLKDIQDSYAKGMITMTQYYELYWEIMENIKDAEEEQYNNQKEHINELIDMVSEMLKQEAEDMIDALEKQKDKYADIVEAKKEALQLTRDQLDYEDELKSKGDELAELQALASLYGMDQTREGRAKYNEILSQIEEKQNEISDLQGEHAFDATNDALDNAQEKFEESIDLKVESIQEEMENQGLWLQGVYDYIKNTDPSTLLQELTDYNFKYGDGLNSTVTTLWENTEPLLESNNYNIEKIVSLLEDYTKEGSSENSSNYKTRSEVYSMAMASKTRKNSDAKNLNMAGDIQRYFANAYYDPDTNVWYTNDSKKVTVAAYPIIQDMKAIAQDASLSKSKKKNKISPLLKKLKTYWGYSNAHFDYDKLHLYKTSGTKIRIFHSGLSGGFVGEGYTPSQKESYALLTNDELVLNKGDQFRLANQIQVWESVKKALSGLVSHVGVVGSPSPATINITVDAPVNISGNADASTAKELDKFGKKIANETLSRLQSAMGQRGYSSRVSQGAMKKL